MLKTTGCNVPCIYKEYKIFNNEPLSGATEEFGIGIMFPKTEITLEEEAYVYPFVSFVAEFGGALGLFLGFSFFMVWDFVVLGYSTIIRHFK